MSMSVVENVINAYNGRDASGNWAEWAAKYPDAAGLLAGIEKELNA
jgi:hypothetical protein